MLMLDI